MARLHSAIPTDVEVPTLFGLGTERFLFESEGVRADGDRLVLPLLVRRRCGGRRRVVDTGIFEAPSPAATIGVAVLLKVVDIRRLGAP